MQRASDKKVGNGEWREERGSHQFMYFVQRVMTIVPGD